MTKAFPTSTLNSEPDRDDEVVKRFQRVHYWHSYEVPTVSGDVCCWGVDRTYRGHHETDAFDPKQT